VAHSINIGEGQQSSANRSLANEASCLPACLRYAGALRCTGGQGETRNATRSYRSTWILCASYGLLSIYWIIIASVSIYDMHLTVKYAGTLKSLEQNPVGRWLMQLDSIQENVIPDTTLFLSFKSLGTIAVMLILAILIRQRARLGHPIAIGVTLFQISLAWYLKYGDIPDNWFV